MKTPKTHRGAVGSGILLCDSAGSGAISAAGAERRAGRWFKAAKVSSVAFGATGINAFFHAWGLVVWGLVAVAHVAIVLRWMRLHDNALESIGAEREAAERDAFRRCSHSSANE